MQSGISASQELVSQFNTLLSSDSYFGLLVNISNEALNPLELLQSTSSDFASNLSSLAPHLDPKTPLYILLRRYPTSPRLVAVTYIPDTAHVRQKTLFASTRLSLIRELGSEHFREQIFSTTAAELTPEGFKKHDAHTKLEAPLTEEEQSLGAVKRAEMEAGLGSGRKEIHLSKHFAMPVTEDALAAITEVGQEGGRVVTILKINPETENVELVHDNPIPCTISDLSRVISDKEPRFTFYRFNHTHNGTESSPVLFFYTCPAVAGAKSIKNRMLYPLMKRAVLGVATSNCGLNIEKKFELEETNEITEESVLAELHPVAQVKQGFSRPKRPGR